VEKRKIRSFEDLVVWQKAIEFVKQVYLVTAEGDLKRDFGLKDQMRRAAVSGGSDDDQQISVQSNGGHQARAVANPADVFPLLPFPHLPF